jgi:hypothetical protein
MWSTTFDAGNLHVRFDEGDVETGIADLGNKKKAPARSYESANGKCFMMESTAPHLYSTHKSRTRQKSNFSG